MSQTGDDSIFANRAAVYPAASGLKVITLNAERVLCFGTDRTGDSTTLQIIRDDLISRANVRRTHNDYSLAARIGTLG